jgi:uncharacterized membrane protein YbhN (UPF0104 family)
VKRASIELGSLVDRRFAAAAGVVTLTLLAVAATPQLLGPDVRGAFGHLESAQAHWLWVGGFAFAVALVANGWAWRAALALCGGRLSRTQAVARYGIGSLVNAATPARLGDAVRIALFSRSLPSRDRLWTTGGVFTTIGAARALCLGVLGVYATASGVLPGWPLLVIALVLAIATIASVLARHRRIGTGAAHLLDAFRGLARSPLQGARVVLWIGLATAARVVAVTAVAAALGLHSPLEAAVLVVPALDLAGLVPLTPGNLGISSTAVAMALQGHGVGLTVALSASIAIHALETCASIAIGLSGALYLAQAHSPAVRRWTLRVAGATASVALAAMLGLTVLDLV